MNKALPRRTSNKCAIQASLIEADPPSSRCGHAPTHPPLPAIARATASQRVLSRGLCSLFSCVEMVNEIPETDGMSRSFIRPFSPSASMRALYCEYSLETERQQPLTSAWGDRWANTDTTSSSDPRTLEQRGQDMKGFLSGGRPIRSP